MSARMGAMGADKTKNEMLLVFKSWLW